MMRVAAYGRYSTDLQKETSIDDQIRLCRERVLREGWSLVNVYSDPAVSGAAMFQRPGIQELMRAGTKGEFDIVICEALDRLSRDQEDVAAIYKRLQFAGVAIITLTEGEITPLHIGFKGTMNAMFLSDLRVKVRRGQQGNIAKGKSAGGLAYGYRVARKTDEYGEQVAGYRVIDPDAASIIRRIFEEYAAGHSPVAIAKKLNAEKVPGPTGSRWTQSTINGNRRRGIGILNNEAYIGVYVWNRQRFVKNPHTGKRVPRFNDEKDLIRTLMPEWRIVDQELWEKVKARQRALPKVREDFWKGQRPKYLLSGLIRCGVCGGGCHKTNHNRYGCMAARTTGTCSNHLKIEQSVLEDAVTSALRTHLMDADLCALFCKEYAAHINRLKQERNAKLAGYHAEMMKLERRRKYIANCIMDGMPGGGFKDEMIAIMERKDELATLIEESPEEKVIIHPNMAHRYRQEVNNLIRLIDGDGSYRGEAHDVLRKLIDKVELIPDQANQRLCVNLHGDLAGILSIATKTQHRNDGADVGVFKLVAEEGFEPPTQGL